MENFEDNRVSEAVMAMKECLKERPNKENWVSEVNLLAAMDGYLADKTDIDVIEKALSDDEIVIDRRGNDMGYRLVV